MTASERATYKISEVARAAQVTVRALRYYDEIGLLQPSARSAAGYRLYTRDDVLRLQAIKASRELGFSLDETKAQLDSPDHDIAAALAQRRAQLVELLDTTHAMIAAIDRAIAASEAPEAPIDLAAIFDGFDPSEYEAEAEQRWGHTDAFAESSRRTQQYGPEDWQRIKAEQAAIVGEFAAQLSGGAAPDDDAVLELAERHRVFIDVNFYPCSRSVHARLAELYTSDPRFAEFFEAHPDHGRDGLASFVAEAIRANALARGD